jgi:hypothetical protein
MIVVAMENVLMLNVNVMILFMEMIALNRPVKMSVVKEEVVIKE